MSTPAPAVPHEQALAMSDEDLAQAIDRAYIRARLDDHEVLAEDETLRASPWGTASVADVKRSRSGSGSP